MNGDDIAYAAILIVCLGGALAAFVYFIVKGGAEVDKKDPK